MKIREIKELQIKTEAELKAMLSEAREALTNARLEHAQRKLSNTTSLASLRHDIARMQTILRMKTQQQTSSQESTDAKAMADKGGSA